MDTQRGPPEAQDELRPFTALIPNNQPAPEGHLTMITPEYSKAYNCRVCGWRHCPGCDEPPEIDDPYADNPEALGWRLATTEDLFTVPKDDGPPPSDVTL